MRRFAVVGKGPSTADPALLDKLAKFALVPDENAVAAEMEYGWCGPRHVLDTRFDLETTVFNDALVFGLRVDVHKIPAELRKAYRIIEEDAMTADGGTGAAASARRKRVRETVEKRIEKEIRDGRYRRSKMTPVLWDIPAQILYAPAPPTIADSLVELFQRTFDLELFPMTSGTAAKHRLEKQSRRRDYEDLRPTRFVLGDGGDGVYPEYPWIAKGPQPKDFLGNEFLQWLAWSADDDGTVSAGPLGEVAVMIDRVLDLDCAYGQSGRALLSGVGPARFPETRAAFRVGKTPRKAGLVLDWKRLNFACTIGAESLNVTGLQLPDVEEADTPRKLFEERIALLRDFWQVLDGLFGAFVAERCASGWESKTAAIRKWIMQSNKPAMAMA